MFEVVADFPFQSGLNMAHIRQLIELFEFLRVLHKLPVLHLNQSRNVGVDLQVGRAASCKDNA